MPEPVWNCHSVLPFVGVDGDEFAGLLAGEQQSAAGRQHRRPLRMVPQRRAPLLLGGQRLDRIDMADRLAVGLLGRQIFHELDSAGPTT